MCIQIHTQELESGPFHVVCWLSSQTYLNSHNTTIIRVPPKDANIGPGKHHYKHSLQPNIKHKKQLSSSPNPQNERVKNKQKRET